MRAFTAAALQLAPLPGPLGPDSVAGNCDASRRLAAPLRRGHRAELVVLPETAPPGSSPGRRRGTLGPGLGVPGPVTEPTAGRGPRGSASTWSGGPTSAVERRGIVHNSAALIGPSGDVLGVYRKTHPFGSELAERGGWVTPGNEVVVVETALGRIGLIICFDGDYPELCRIAAVRGAQLIARPSALLRSADIWELTNRARAYDNHVFLVGANATGADPAGSSTSATRCRHPDRGRDRPRGQPRELGQRPDRPRHRDGRPDPGLQHPARLRPPGRAQPGPDPRHPDDLQAPAKTSFPHS